MQRFIGAKLINAKPMTRLAYNKFRGWQLPKNENGEDEGYLVEAINGGQANTQAYSGYVSWSPKELFEREYYPVNGLSFGLALEALKKGFKVTRAGWHGKGMWIALVKAGRYDVYDARIKPGYSGGFGLLPWIGMKTPNNDFVPWLASQTDMLANDWAIFSE